MELGNYTELKRNILAAHNALKMQKPDGFEVDMGRLEIIPISEIECDYTFRAREEYGDHKVLIALAMSIAEVGLIQPVVVYSESGNPPFQLLAGGRRMVACRDILQVDEISCRVYTTKKTYEELRTIEYYENVRRKDFSWQEADKMRRMLHLDLVEMKGEKVERSPTAAGHSQADTAKLLGVSKATISNSLRRAEIMEKLPQLGIQNSKTAFEADKKVRVAAETIRAQMSAEEVPKTLSAKQKLILDSYIRGDFFLNQFPDSSFNFLEVDPPYGINLNKNRFYNPDEIMDLKNYIEPMKEDYPEFLTRLVKECWRLAAKDSWLIMWHAVSWGDTIRELLTEQGFKVAHADCVWVKGNNPGYTNQVDVILGHAHELFIYARKGNPMLHNKGRADVFNHPVVPINQRIHPTEKPMSLMKDILQTFCFGGHKILTPFAGSGNTILAAYDYGMSAKGFDLSPTFFMGYFKRVMQNYSQLELGETK
jgi:ParB-like chromosome segregation protein Spo0J